MSRILIVEDVVAARDAMARLLQHDGHDVMVAGNGAEALARLKQAVPDLIVLDQMMPEVDGLTFLASLRRFPKWKQLPVIILTGLKDRASAMRAQTLGVSAYLQKDELAPADLLQRIRQFAAKDIHHIDRPGPSPFRVRTSSVDRVRN
jgi:CheY-like chemotaxis protein